MLPALFHALAASMRQFIAAACLLASAPLSAAQEFLARAPTEPLPPAGEGSYLDVGPGVCHFRGRAPVGQFLASVGQQACQDLCTADAACWGFSQDPASGACALFRQGPLASGGPAWGGAGCSVKASGRAEAAAIGPPRAHEVATQAPAETAYEVEGAGPCTVDGRLPLAEAFPSANGAVCRSICTARADCYGYDYERRGACRILAEAPLAGGCARKMQVVGRGGAGPPAPGPQRQRVHRPLHPGQRLPGLLERRGRLRDLHRGPALGGRRGLGLRALPAEGRQQVGLGTSPQSGMD